MQGSCYSPDYPDSLWFSLTNQESSRAFDSHQEPASGDVDERVFRTIDRNDFLGFAYEYPGLEADTTIQWPIHCPGRGSQRTPKNNDDSDKWGSPGAIRPPDSFSPLGLRADFSPYTSTSSGPRMTRYMIVTTGQPLSCQDGGQSRVIAPFGHQADLDAFIFPATMQFDHSPSHSLTPKHQIRQVSSARTNMAADLHGQSQHECTSESGSSKAAFTATQGPLVGRLRAMSRQQVVANVHDICAATTRISSSGQASNLDKADETKHVSTRKGLVPLSRKRALLPHPTVLDLAVSNEPQPLSSRGTEDDGSHDTTTTSNEQGSVTSSKMPSRKVPIVSVSCPTQATLDGCLKRHRSSLDCLPESKKIKLDRTVSHVSCASNTSIEPKYQATEPASIRRARSLRSDVSACSDEQTDSLFYPSPLSSPTSGSCADENYPPTVPSTPLPTSADYARSKANPLARTIAFYRRRSLNIPAIPPVPVIAPPQDCAPTLVRCAEDHAIDRLRAILFRERSERERDGLNICDEKRVERLKVACATDVTFPRRDSGSTSDSSDSRGQWEDESTRSATESQESWDLVSSVNIPSEQHRLVSREIWSSAFGITDGLRKEITRWILKKLPKEPVPSERLSVGNNLYDQLTNSHQTRFHAAQLFHRYFLLPDKVEYWKEACKQERLEQETCELCEDTDWKQGVWALGVACMALGVKLHRDCLPPLGPVYAAEFLAMAPYVMTPNALELAQRDIMYTFQFLLGSCTPQDVLDELWIALPTLRKATAPVRDGWAVVQSVIWDKLFESLLEPDVLQYPITLLTAATLIEGLISVLTRHFHMEAEVHLCQCKASSTDPVFESLPDDIEPTSSQIHLFEAMKLVDNVILDVRDVLQLSDMELDECRKWLSYDDRE